MLLQKKKYQKIKVCCAYEEEAMTMVCSLLAEVLEHHLHNKISSKGFLPMFCCK